MDSPRSGASGSVEAAEGWSASFAVPPFDFDPLPASEIFEVFHGGEVDADRCERMLAATARIRGALDVAIAEGLHALRQGDRLAELSCHLDDYAREVLDLGKRAADGLAALGAALRERPYLREALRSGRVRLRAAETILPVAKGDREQQWVERASESTIRELEDAVRRARAGALEPEEDWLRLGVHLDAEERIAVNAGLELAGELMPGSTRMERLEAMAQEALSEVPGDDQDPIRLDPAFRPTAPVEATRRAALEAELERWAVLQPVLGISAPDVRFYETATARGIDHCLRALGRLRAKWESLLAYWAYAVKQGGHHARLGFASFRHYVEERLGLPSRAVEQRAALEERIWRSPALQEARRQGLSFERLRALARLTEGEIGSWIARAKALTCVALRRKIDLDLERQTRATGRFRISMPRRIAVVLTVAIEAARRVTGCVLPTGKCLVVLARHFVAVWEPLAKRSRTRAQKVRERDRHECQVPGCSHRAAHSHHVVYRSRMGGDEPQNQIATCEYHHLRCIHSGRLRVTGRAPDGLTWFLGRKEWRGPGLDDPPVCSMIRFVDPQGCRPSRAPPR